MKDIKKLLREQAQNVLPDESVKQNIRRELGMAQPTQEQAALAHGGTKALSSKKMWIALTALFLAVALALCLLLPALLKKGGTGGGLNKFTSIETTEDFYLYGAASVGSLLSAREQAAALSTKSLSSAAPAAQELSGSEQEIVDTVNGYLSLVEGLLGDGKIEHSQVAAPSDPAYADYRYYTTIRYKDLLGEAVTYELYYNELLNGVEQEDGEREENYDIEGILVVNGTAYARLPPNRNRARARAKTNCNLPPTSTRKRRSTCAWSRRPSWKRKETNRNRNRNSSTPLFPTDNGRNARK